MLKNGRPDGSIDQIKLDFVEREASPEFLMKLSIQLHLSASLSLSNTVRVCEVFGVQRAQSTVHNWVHKANLQPNLGKNPESRYYTQALHRLWTQDRSDVSHWDRRETRGVWSRVSHWWITIITSCVSSAGYDFRYEKHGTRSAVKRAFC